MRHAAACCMLLSERCSQLAKGVYVMTGRAGVHTVNDSLRGCVGREELLDEGDDLQFDGQADEMAETACGEFADGLQISGTLSAVETAKRAAAADAAKPTVLEDCSVPGNQNIAKVLAGS